jgi:hypothetical protein
MLVFKYKPRHEAAVILKLEELIEQIRLDASGDAGWLSTHEQEISIQALEMTADELAALPEFEGW